MESQSARVIYLRPLTPKPPKRQVQWHKWVAIGLVLLLLYPFFRDLWRLRMVRQEMATVKQEISQLQRESEALRSELDAWQDPELIERVARERLGLVRPGEILYYVGEVEGNSSAGR